MVGPNGRGAGGEGLGRVSLAPDYTVFPFGAMWHSTFCILTYHR